MATIWRAHHSPWPRRSVVAAIVVFRLVNALLTQTSFVPDEYWQSLEVAHRSVFGYGYLTWEWTDGKLRGFLHPAVFAALNLLLQKLAPTEWLPELIVVAPRLLQAVIASVGDCYVYRLAFKLYGNSRRAANLALVCHLTAWFGFYTMCRTLSNSMEAVGTVIALYYWPLPSPSQPLPKDIDFHKALAAAAVTTLLRPTSAILWIVVVLHHLWTFRFAGFLRLVSQALVVGMLALGAATALDYIFYQELVFVQLNFLRFNLLTNAASFYGVHAWHWYWSQGLPAVQGPLIVPFARGAWLSLFDKSMRPTDKAANRWLLLLITATVAALSLQPHKEFRFVLPLLPLVACLCGSTLELARPRTVKLCIAFLVLVSAPLALYTSLVHQRGTIDVMQELRTEASQGRVSHVLFLMPCHSTPYYSHLHFENVSMSFLECPPPQFGRNEVAAFYENPLLHLQNQFDAAGFVPPSHIVLFDSLFPDIEPFLFVRNYSLMKELFHAHIVTEDHVGGKVMIFSSKLA
ncbi:GPI mannosyltransferase 3 [Capsaspora owczarzaki ATCC 30864]|uniref:Mannosyltransferase n=1 Tax=Capsaspora owczarzaki (strain ATCC 30864) TaxID=595528 RepID=A0A0D2WJI2_CAPO3|nr:GPI mannosyltransferase 3 [Capsaspora owczarzaki ATCC 30864]KJE90215.1 GPI mannosyltransferase 3 [Capsaspora owczarzaki ATCC 30864]|eukprot:XP_004364424.1 GPI mannosyltransferase 3 [Capsaspora owczarzaki ATCC 30864]